jgi:hypothetical protein
MRFRPSGAGCAQSRAKEEREESEDRTAVACDAETVRRAACLDLGRVRYACELVVNGRRLGRRIWAPYVFPIRNRLRVGLNEIRVIVANTMANQFAATKVLDRWPEEIVGPYHRIAALFERESLPSGLHGPVRIMA